MSKNLFKTLGVPVVLALLLACPQRAQAQEAKAETPAQGSASTKPVVVLPGYRVEYVIRELEDGRRINSRTYTLMAREQDWARIRVGSRVPITVGNVQQYQNVGMNIDCLVHEVENSTFVESKIDSSSVAGPENTPSPVLRNLRTETNSLVTLGKPTVIAVVDDAVSTHKYEIEVTVTKVK